MNRNTQLANRVLNKGPRSDETLHNMFITVCIVALLTSLYELILSTDMKQTSISDTSLTVYWKTPLICAAYAKARPARAGGTCP
jgi:hypothetical protein